MLSDVNRSDYCTRRTAFEKARKAIEIPTKNTDRELWREPFPDPPGDYYAPSIHVTAQGAIGIDVAGTVFVRTLQEWHSLAERLSRAEQRVRWLEQEVQDDRALWCADVSVVNAQTSLISELGQENDALKAENERLHLALTLATEERNTREKKIDQILDTHYAVLRTPEGFLDTARRSIEATRRFHSIVKEHS